MKFLNRFADVGTVILIPAVVAYIVQIIADAYLQSLQTNGGIVTATAIFECRHAGLIAFIGMFLLMYLLIFGDD